MKSRIGANVKIAITILFLLLQNRILAQEIKVGLQGGGNISNVVGDFGHTYHTEDKAGFFFGAFFNKNLSNTLR